MVKPKLRNIFKAPHDFISVMPGILECHAGANLDEQFLQDMIDQNEEFFRELAGPDVKNPMAMVEQAIQIIQGNEGMFDNLVITQTPVLFDWEKELARALHANPKYRAQSFIPVVSNKNIPLLDHDTRLEVIGAAVSFDHYAPIVLPFDRAEEMLATYLQRNQIQPGESTSIQYIYDIDPLYESELYVDDLGRLRQPGGYKPLDIRPQIEIVDGKAQYVFDQQEPMEVYING